MQTAAAVECLRELLRGGIEGVLGVCATYRAFPAEGVTHVGVRENTEGYAEMAHGTEAAHGVLKVSVASVLLYAAFGKVGELKGRCHIEDEGERVHIGIGCRVEVVYMVTLAKCNAYSVHSAARPNRLIRDYSEPVHRIWRIGTALCKSCGRNGHSKQRKGCFFHSVCSIFAIWCKIIEKK